jgi:uncharacterized protein YoaH (UPF0181 family)
MTDRMPMPPTELREKAQIYGEEAVEKLAELMGGDKSSTAIQLSAARALLERGYGRPASLRDEDDDAPFTVLVENYGGEDADAEADA